MSSAKQLEDVHVLRRPPRFVGFLRSLFQSLATAAVLSVIAANTTALFTTHHIGFAWSCASLVGCVIGPFLDFGALHSFRQMIYAVESAEQAYPGARIFTPDENGVIRLRFYLPFRKILFEDGLRVFIFRQTWSQYFVRNEPSVILTVLAMTLSLEAGLLWCSLASLGRHTTGFLSRASELWAVLLGPAVGTALVALIAFLEKNSKSSAGGSANAANS